MCFEQEIIKHIPNLKNYAFKLTKRIDEIEDLVQNTLLRALEKKHLYQDNNLRSWLFRIMHNNYVNHVRSTTLYRPNIIFVDEYIVEPLATDNPEMSVIVSDLGKAFSTLTEKKKIAILQEVTGEEKEVLTKNTFNNRRWRARKELRDMLEGIIPIRGVKTKFDKKAYNEAYKIRNKEIVREKNKLYKRRIRDANRNSSNSQLSP